jgi:hypothetical protein
VISLSRLLPLLVPPVVVAAAVGGVFARAASPETLRVTREESIRVRWSVPSEFDRLQVDIEAYLSAYGEDLDARRFATEAFARMLLPQRALEVALPAGRPADPQEARRFAAIVLEVLGSIPGPPPHPTALYPRTTLARIDAGDAAAREELFATVKSIQMNDIVDWFIPAYRSETQGKRALVEALSRREDSYFQLAAAIGATGPRVTDRVPFLLGILRSAEWREARRPTWQQICRALGSSKTPEALEALRAERASRTETGPEGDMRRLTVDVALALAGDESARAHVLEVSADFVANDWVSLLYVGGLQTRLFQGDLTAADDLAALWRLVEPKPGTHPLQEPITRLQLVVGCLLCDALPPPTIPADEWMSVFEKHASPLHRAIALAWAWRHRRPGALDEMVEELRKGLATAPVFNSAAYDTSGVAAVVEILRAWYRWS